MQFISVCDPNRESYDYPQWGRSQGEKQGAPGGREIGRKAINEYYAKKSGKGSWDGVTAYADFREQLEKESDLDAIFIMTPDHLRGRMTGTNMIFANGGPQLGELEAGVVGAALGVPFAIVSGGIATVLLTAWIAWRYPRLREYTAQSALVE